MHEISGLRSCVSYIFNVGRHAPALGSFLFCNSNVNLVSNSQPWNELTYSVWMDF
jgi:hypothetical protein